ncbi:MAG: T9SS type A sorting domain-containing protein [Bacteroidetes bacterium]|nr:T9SS type A sorting domain-containing protein [Bacteroidota bacterium]
MNISDADIVVADLTGRVSDLPHTSREIDVSGLAPGVCVLCFQDGEGSVVRRFVRE